MANIVRTNSNFERVSTPITTIFLYQYIPIWLRRNKDFNSQITKNSYSIEIGPNRNENIDFYNISNENYSKSENSYYSIEENKIISYFSNELQSK